VDRPRAHCAQDDSQSASNNEVQKHAIAEYLVYLLRIVLAVMHRQEALRSSYQCISDKREHGYHTCHYAVYTIVALT
jgi:hypothetical protein